MLQYVSRPEEVDLLALSHESIPSLFVHFGVQDVRTIQQRARTEASKKQTELRTMVGERYRDLLGAADSIVRMRHSSEHLLKHLGQAKRDCTQEHMQRRSRACLCPLVFITNFMLMPHAVSKQPSHSKTASVAELSGEPVHHSLAMLIKLLLDSPEHIWRALEAQDALSAARLAMLARVVYRELASMSLSDEQAENAHDQGREKTPDVFMAFPIAEKQWDTLSQLATQVVRRAKADLQRWQVSDQVCVPHIL